MNRPIKFRAWDTFKNVMYSAEEMGRDELTISPDGRGFVNVNSFNPALSEYYDNLMPMQFTGRHDKSGREIYEGDIVNLGGVSAYEVTFFNGGFCVIFESWKLRGDMAYRPLSIFPEREIIGNKFENPEILEVKS